jgi:hypothetical protein
MKEIAWQIRTKSAGSVAGFVTLPEPDRLEQEPQKEAGPEAVPAAVKSK